MGALRIWSQEQDLLLLAIWFRDLWFPFAIRILRCLICLYLWCWAARFPHSIVRRLFLFSPRLLHLLDLLDLPHLHCWGYDHHRCRYPNWYILRGPPPPHYLISIFLVCCLLQCCVSELTNTHLTIASAYDQQHARISKQNNFLLSFCLLTYPHCMAHSRLLYYSLLVQLRVLILWFSPKHLFPQAIVLLHYVTYILILIYKYKSTFTNAISIDSLRKTIKIKDRCDNGWECWDRLCSCWWPI